MAPPSTKTITSMTSIFTPAAGCANSWTYEDKSYNGFTGGLFIQNINSAFNTACFPPNFSSVGRAPGTIQVYSPGACPFGYGTPGVQVSDGTTTLTCCPESFSYSSSGWFGCVSVFSGTTTIPARASNISELSTTTIHATGAAGVTMWGQPITVEYMQKDLSLFSPSSTTTTTSSASDSDTSPTSSPSPSPSSPSSPPTTTSFSTSAKAGIGIIIFLLALVLFAIARFFIVRRRKNNISRKSTSPLPESNKGSKEPYRHDESDIFYALPLSNEYVRRELNGSSEMQVKPSTDLRSESGRGRGRRYELE